MNRLKALVSIVRQTITALGAFVMVAGALGLLGWRLFGWEELRVVFAGCALLLAIALVLTIGRSAVTAQLVVDPERVVVGDIATAGVRVRNPAARRVLPVRVEIPVGKGLARFDVPSLAGHGLFESPFVIPTNRRAIIPIGPARSVRGDPLGLLRREVELSPSRELFVHPRTVGLASLSAGWIRDLEGETTNDRSMSDLAFYALREYAPGDARRHIHWKSTAKRVDGKLMVREFLDTRRSHLALVLATNRAEYGSDVEFELAVSVVASLGSRAFVDEQQVTCIGGSGPLVTYSRQRFMDQLAGISTDSGSPTLLATAQHARELAGAASVAVIVGGSGLLGAELHRVASRFTSDVRVIGARCVERGSSSVRATGARSLVEIGSLDALPLLMHTVHNA